MSEKLSPMQKAAHIPRGFIQCPDGITIQHWSKALDEALRILRNDDALGRMDATAREVMAGMVSDGMGRDSTRRAARECDQPIDEFCAGIAYDAAEALESERERRMQLPEESS